MALVIDTETTGLDPLKCSILSLGAVDTLSGNTFYRECAPWEGAQITPIALAVNGFSPETWRDKEPESALIRAFLDWTAGVEDLTPVGQNVAFDLGFINAACRRAGLVTPFGYRSVDLHALSWFVLTRSGHPVPAKNRRSNLGLDESLSFVGIDGREGAHNALEDARLEAELLRRLLVWG